MYPQLKPREVPKVLAVCAATYRALWLHGASGIGKSEVILTCGKDSKVKEVAWRQWAEATGKQIPSVNGSLPDLEVVVFTLPQHEAEDFSGVPFHRTLATDEKGNPTDRTTKFAPVDEFRRERPTILFLDEVLAGEVRTMKAIMQIVKERRIANVPLTPGTVIILAANRAEDRAANRTAPFPLGNRAAHFTFVTNESDWLAWAEGEGIHGLFRAFVRQHGIQGLHRYDAQNPSLAQLTPRSFEAAARAYVEAREHGLDPELAESLIQANIGAEDGQRLAAFLRLQDELPTWDEILADPLSARLPSRAPDRVYYVMGLLIDRLNAPGVPPQAVAAIATYLARLVRENPLAMDGVAWLLEEVLFTRNNGKGKVRRLNKVSIVVELQKHPVLAQRIPAFMEAVSDVQTLAV